MDILDFIASDNYIPYNRTLAKMFGVENAIVFGALCGYQRHYGKQEFFREQSAIMEDTCLTEYAVRKSIKDLKALNLISVTKKGLPAQYYYKINTTRLIEILTTSDSEYVTTSGVEICTTGACENNTTNYKNDNKINNNIKKEILYKEKNSNLLTESINDTSRDSEFNEMHYHNDNVFEEPVIYSKTNRERKHHYGVYKNILLTDTELEKLKQKFTNWEDVINYVDEHIEMKGYKYKSHYLAILKWFKNKSRADNLDSGFNKKTRDTSTIDDNGVISL